MLPLQESRSFVYTNLHGQNCFSKHWANPKPGRDVLVSIYVSLLFHHDGGHIAIRSQPIARATRLHWNSFTATQQPWHCSTALQLNQIATLSHCDSKTLRLQECPEITYMTMGFGPRSLAFGGMCVKGIGRPTKVENITHFSFPLFLKSKTVLHKSFVFTSLGTKSQSEKHSTGKPNRFGTISPDTLVSCTCPVLGHHHRSWLCRSTEGSAKHEAGS